ncbi:unannotated protein [freshwater metagenome]|uniref:Unannotated protein n=1 Tax=freshwater metagenome TaxID=449393 RepID=A0A6J7H1Y3_9ZZZZ
MLEPVGARPGASLPALLRRCPAWVLTALLAVVWLIVDPPTPDLAAHQYRADVFRTAHALIWEQGWYAGHHLPGYSVLVPPIASVITPQALAALCVAIAAWCFERLAQGHWTGNAARAATLWFAIGVTSTLLGGQLAFAAGLAPGLAALLVARSGPRWAALALGALTTLTSPIAAAFLVYGCAAWWLGTRDTRAAWPAVGAVVPGVLIAVAFPQGGVQPFGTVAALISLAVALLVLPILPRGERLVRWGAGLYGALIVGAMLIDTPVGGNLVRLAAVFGGPVVAGALWGRRALALALLAPVLFAWQWSAPVRSIARDAHDPARHEAYHAPLIAELDRRAAVEGPFRLEIPFTRTHWETRWVALRHPLARGWERQLDVKENDLFYEGVLTPQRYRDWLDTLAVHYVAVPDTVPDPAGRAETRLVTAGAVPGLREVWHDRHWRLYAVAGARPLVAPPLRVSALGADTVTLTTPRPARGLLRVRFSPYLKLTRGRGCLSRGPGGWTLVRLDRPGSATIEPGFALGRIHATAPRCAG